MEDPLETTLLRRSSREVKKNSQYIDFIDDELFDELIETGEEVWESDSGGK